MRKIIALWSLAMMMAVSYMGCVAEVRARPPEVRAEMRSAQPYDDAVWIDGYWQHQHNDWIWIGGRWERRPRPRAEWVPGHWDETHHGWKWKKGHWRG